MALPNLTLLTPPPLELLTQPPLTLWTPPPLELWTPPPLQFMTRPPTPEPNIIAMPAWGPMTPPPNPIIETPPHTTPVSRKVEQWNVSFLNDTEAQLNYSYLNSSVYNESCNNCSFTTSYSNILYPSEMALCLVGIVFNVISLLALSQAKTSKRSSSFYLALKFIAFTDLLFATVDFVYALLMTLLYTDGSRALSAEAFGCWDEILNDLARFSMGPPLIATTCIVIIQSISILYPLKFPTIVNRRRVTLGLVLSLCFQLLVHIGLHVGYLTTNEYTDSGQCWEHFYGEYFWSSVLYVGTICSVLEFFNILLYGLLWWKIKSVLKKEAAISASQHAKGIQKDMKLHVTIGLLLVTIILFWTPAVVMAFLILSFKNNTSRDWDGRYLAQHIAGLFALLNPIIDPIVYGIRLSEVKDGYRRLWRKLFCRCSRSETSSDVVTNSTSRSKQHQVQNTASKSQGSKTTSLGKRPG
ncbi:adrenocorticotropic hormone receptor-like [Lingula anatina]|uniref:Adrenocorticotropic hormone receptor-like n=1 Tax=Lingula anatina TaxID=7574 RepID=A0A1S3JX94_LINAN|nr:adrenocorticotropic hormone receptor-like [Lingula anatina]XP_013414660.1 adrenocorticotropic hormone receptor-like [Lingula anatina]|eukprot:XP_013414659.1 adrenocorticotropic hormone receptor-like [Lingula anatina]